MAFLKEYTMLDELGKGGFATVYKVRHNELGYIRAIRVLNETIVNSESKTYQKFMRECKVLLRLGNGNHPHIVHIYQPALLDNKALVEMDYVDGQDIAQYLKQNQNFVPAEEVIRMAKQIGSALAYCHEDIYRFCMDRDADNLKDDPNDGSKVLVDEETRRHLIDKYKVIHNDIHSGNIMRREDGNFVLLDFGLAINGEEVVRSSRHTNGAPEFKAPEKWDDDSLLTEQSDIYSFGVVLYQYLAGRVPFPYNTRVSIHKAEFELGEAHQKSVPPYIDDIRKVFFEKKYSGQQYKRDFPQWLEDVILRCLSKEPDARFRNGRELYDYILEQSKKSEESAQESGIKQLSLQNEQLTTQIVELKQANQTLKEQLKKGHRGRSFIVGLIILLILGVCGIVMDIFLHNRSDGTDGQHSDLEKKIAAYQDSLNVKNDYISQLKAQLAQMPSQDAEEIVPIDQIQENARILQLEAEITRLNGIIEKNTESYAQQKQTLNDKIAQLETEISVKKKRISELEKSQNATADMRSQVNSLNDKIASLENQLQESKKQYDEVKSNLQKGSQELKQKEKQINELKTQLDKTKTQLSSTEQALNKANAQLKDILQQH